MIELVNERAQMDNLNQNIQTKLALEIAQLSLDKATLQAQVEQLRQQNEELQSQLATASDLKGGDE
ncbi:hypothetical protein [uncultured Streptococcus sp.]|uniref:hypothetical protein n=1 Tax=uncultured Streptococcus sp. TaxID=83427 RepID=UPI0025D35067|nr:hypothetical protein [uncultured Streptococcus sp.]